jgi:NAD(P)-dependent dehydrogenase (short-subunit alcohol dehydrogenase family)
MSQSDQEQIQPPGTEAEMTPQADHGETSYRGCDKLTGRVAVITGGDSGIGRAVAIAYAREGADILISYLNEALSREPHWKRNLTNIRHRSCRGGRALPLLRGFASEKAQRATRDKVALEIERVVDGRVSGEETLG